MDIINEGPLQSQVEAARKDKAMHAKKRAARLSKRNGSAQKMQYRTPDGDGRVAEERKKAVVVRPQDQMHDEA